MADLATEWTDEVMKQPAAGTTTYPSPEQVLVAGINVLIRHVEDLENRVKELERG